MAATRWVTLAMAGAALMADVPAASATQFDGSCQVNGEGAFASPTGYVPTATPWRMEGQGGCTGVLDGAKVVNRDVRLVLEFEDPVTGCAASLASGTGTLVFQTTTLRTKVLRFAQHHVGPAARVTGARSGTGLAYLTAYTQLARQDPATPLQCATGTLSTFAAEWAMKTLGTLDG